MTAKRIKSIVAAVLILAFTLTLFACSRSGDGKNNVKTDDNKQIEKTDVKIVSRGNSIYKIVVPENALGYESFAASELQTFLYRSSGAWLPVISDSKLTFDEDSCFLSVGKTRILTLSGEYDGESAVNLGKSGYILKRYGNNVLMYGNNSGNGYGVMCAAYGFLETSITFTAYASDEFSYDGLDDVYLYDFDEIERPSIDIRSIGYLNLKNDTDYVRRMKLSVLGGSEWAYWGHSQVNFYLPVSKYGDNTDWYNSQMDQLCWSNMEMRDAFVARMIEAYQEYPDALYFMMGQEDMGPMCDCSSCKKAITERTGSYSGLQLEFANYVIERGEEWLQANQKGREVEYIIYAYHETEPAPKNPPQPLSSHPKLKILLAPIGMDFNLSLDDPYNNSAKRNLTDWIDFTGAADRIMLYGYCINFRNYMLNYNNFDGIQQNYKLFADYGVDHYYDQGPVDSGVSGFEELRIFCQSRLMWNVNGSFEALAAEFISAYYKQAAGAMKEYYDYTRMHYALMDKQYSTFNGTIYNAISDSKYWPIEVVNILDGLINKAKAALKPLKSSDPELYNTLLLRVEKEELSVTYLKMQHYYAYYSKADRTAMVDTFDKICNRFNILSVSEGSTMAEYIENTLRVRVNL